MRKAIFRFLVLFFSFFLLFSFLIIFTLSMFTNIDWVSVFLNFNRFPLVVYLFIFSVLIAFLVVIYLTFVERVKLNKIENALNAMAKGEYSSPIFLKMYSKDLPTQISNRIDKLFLNLHEKVVLMSNEAVNSDEEKIKMNKETKEEILEQERHRIARELHDSVSQQLFASSMMLSAVNQEKEQLPDQVAKQLEMIENITNESQSEMRALLLHLRPIQLDDKTLKQGIEQLLKELSTKISTNIKYEIENIQLPLSIEDNLFRIVQELLSNVLRHAKASELEVYFKKSGETTQLRVIDDGVGFDMNQKKTGSYGLQNIRERISSIGGNVRIVSFENQGTTVEINIPSGIGGE